MLAFVANTTTSWECFMNTIDDRERDHGQDLVTVAESAASTRRVDERVKLADSSRYRQTRGADSRSRFLIVLLRALSAWPA
jgi:hypothetical protein